MAGKRLGLFSAMERLCLREMTAAGKDLALLSLV